jgi:ankyrin repeat protein
LFYIFLVAHICVKKENLDYLKAIVEAYFILVENKEDFYNWITSENSEGMTPIDIACQYSNRETIKYLFEIIKKTNEKKLKLSEKRNNMFHSAAKSNECFSIVK